MQFTGGKESYKNMAGDSAPGANIPTVHMTNNKIRVIYGNPNNPKFTIDFTYVPLQTHHFLIEQKKVNLGGRQYEFRIVVDGTPIKTLAFDADPDDFKNCVDDECTEYKSYLKDVYFYMSSPMSPATGFNSEIGSLTNLKTFPGMYVRT